MAEHCAGGGVKAQRGRDEIDERRSRLQFEPGEIAAMREVASFEMLVDAQPIVCGLKRKVNVFGSFQFDDGEPA